MKQSEVRKTLHSLVEESASKHPQQVCVVYDSGQGEAAEQQSITYSQLWQQVQEIKSVFENLSLKEQIIGVLLADGPNIPSVLIGLSVSSCAFHPFTIGGLQYTATGLITAGTSWILAHSQLVQKLSPLLMQLEGSQVPSDVLSKHGLQLFRIKHSSTSTLTSLKHFDLAYCITTSGTSSSPKVVHVPHSCIVPNIISLRNIFKLDLNDRVLLTSPLTFDPSIIDIFCTLSSGACLIIVPSEVKRMPGKLLNIIHDRQAVTVIQATPTLLRRFSPSELQRTLLGPASSLRLLALGGEMFPNGNMLRGWLHADNHKTQLYNLYGVTEVSCWASCQLVHPWTVLEKDEPVPIGAALGETVIKLVASDIDRGVSDSDDEGDIWIGSETRLCLIDDEVNEDSQDKDYPLIREKPEILWRNTGDRGKRLSDGSIICLGRRDDQVKRHGKRLNLEAAEMVCKEVTDVLDCCALLDQSNLMVFIIMNSPTSLNVKENSKQITEFSKIDDEMSIENLTDESNLILYINGKSWAHLKKRLKTHVEECLPSHYVPSIFVKINGPFPQTQNGKLDKKLLVKIGNAEMKDEVGTEIGNAWDFSQKLWQANLPDPSVSMHYSDNFISLGGDSLAAVRVISILENVLKCSLPSLLDLLINKDFGNFTEEFQKNVNLKMSDTVMIPQSLVLSENMNSSLVKSDIAGSLSQVKKTAHEDKQTLNINFRNIENKDVHFEGLKHRLLLPTMSTSKVAKYDFTKIDEAKHTKFAKTDEVNFDLFKLNEGRYANLTHLNESKTVTVSNSVTLSMQPSVNSELPLEVYNHKSSKEEWRFGNAKDKSFLNADFCNTTGKLVLSPILNTIVSRGRIWRNNICDREPSGIVTELTNSDMSMNNCGSDLVESGIPGGVSDKCYGDLTSNTLRRVVDLRMKWNFDTNKCVDASPLLVQYCDRMLAFIGSHSGQFSAINILAGSLLWAVTLPDRIESSACCSLCGNFVIVGCYDGIIYVFCARSGSIVWTFATGDAVKCSPVVDDCTGYVVCGSHDGYLYTLDLNVQACVWKYHMGGGSVFSSPVVDVSSRLVYAASLAGKIVCFCADTGTVKWTHDLQKPVFSSLCLLGHSVLVGCVDGKLYCISSLGHIEWTFLTQAPIFSTPIIHNSSVLVGSHDQHVYCLNSAGHQIWTFQTSSPVYSTAFASKFIKHIEQNKDQCSDCQCGALTQHLRHSSGMLWSVVVTASTSGTLYALNLEDGQVLAEVKLLGEVFSSPVIVDNFVVVGCRDNFVYCFELT